VSATEIFMMLRGFIPAVMIVAIGVVIGRWDASRHQQTLIRLIDYIFLPCLTFSAIHKHPFDLKELLQIGSAVTVMVCLLGIVSLAVMGGKAGWRSSNLVAALFMSSGTLLLPLAYMLFGSEGLAKAIYFHLFVLLLYHTLGTYLADGRATPVEFFKIPSLYTVLLGIAAAASPLSVPENLQEFAWLSEKGIDITGMGALPLLLINFGYPLGLIRFSTVRKGLAGGLVRIVAGPLIAFLLVLLYRKTGWLGMDRGYDILAYINLRTTEAVLVLGAAMPSSHYALRLDPGGRLLAGDTDTGTVIVSAIGGIVTVAAVLFFINLFIFID
jgi:predicted permease